MIESGEMPPEKKKQPSDKGGSGSMPSGLRQMLLENDKPGGTVLRRLNKEEYEKSVSRPLQNTVYRTQ